MYILVLNAGSSSLKYQLFDMARRQPTAKGLCERIGIDGKIKHSPKDKPEYLADRKMDSHRDAIKVVLELLTDAGHGVISGISEIGAVGHRVVHGGESLTESMQITDEVIKVIDECSAIAPLHNPPNLTGILACREIMGGVPQVAVFDTAFHAAMPIEAFLYPLPYEYYEKFKIRRYGFHGTSHKYVSGRAAVMLGRPLDEIKVVTCHLGNGSSIAAVKGGRSVDTSMGFTPLEGVPMGTRCGYLDPAIIPDIMRFTGLDINGVIDVLNKKSGALGVSGVSSDFRDIMQAAEGGNARARAALDIFCYSIKKYIGSYAAAMGGVDAVVFTAGIGENNAVLRGWIADGLEFMGITIDKQKNASPGKGEVDISADGSRVRTLVIPTDEELVIAEDTERIVAAL